MKLMERDSEIIKWIETNKGATIEQIAQLFFSGYRASANRLKMLTDNNLLKADIHPMLGKKVYYTNKLPSFHSLVINDIALKLKDEIKYIEREAQVKTFKVDCLMILQSNKVILIEVDIFNRTSDKRLQALKDTMNQTYKELFDMGYV